MHFQRRDAVQKCQLFDRFFHFRGYGPARHHLFRQAGKKQLKIKHAVIERIRRLVPPHVHFSIRRLELAPGLFIESRDDLFSMNGRKYVRKRARHPGELCLIHNRAGKTVIQLGKHMTADLPVQKDAEHFVAEKLIRRQRRAQLIHKLLRLFRLGGVDVRIQQPDAFELQPLAVNVRQTALHERHKPMVGRFPAAKQLELPPKRHI
ncbi:hypothetical protein AVP43_02647 [Geobacillus stearothermophilus]|nr:hypothetical protein AVP43_02647 [Geobacillus stearothermophilus]